MYKRERRSVFDNWENEVDVRRYINRIGYPAVYKECESIRKTILKALGTDPEAPSRWNVIVSWNKLPMMCHIDNKSPESKRWREIAQFPTSWEFHTDEDINRAPDDLDVIDYIKWDNMKEDLINEYYDRAGQSFSNEGRDRFVLRHLPWESLIDNGSIIADYWLKMLGAKK